MNIKRIKIDSALFLLGFSMLACSFGGRATAAPAGDAVATSVAATVNALAAQTKPPSPPQKTSLPTVKPVVPTGQPTAASIPPPVAAVLRVVYTDGNHNLWLWKEGGAPLELVKTGNVQDAHISSDGSLVVFTRLEETIHYSLWVTGLDGKEPRILVNSSDFEAMPSVPEKVSVAPLQVQWLPGSHTLLFNTHPLFDGPGFMVNNDLWQLNADSGERRNLLQHDQGGVFVISPDGKQLAIITSNTIGLINSDGSNPRSAVFKYTPVSTYSEYVYNAEARWSPDSNSLRVVIPPAESLSNPGQASDIWNIPLDGSAASRLGGVVTAPLAWAALSPDLQKVAYLAPFGDASQNQRELRAAGVDGSVAVVFQKGQLAHESWAPDSSHIIFTDQEKNITYIQAAGGDKVALADGKVVDRLQWVDDARFLYLVTAPSGWDLHLGTLDGGRTLIASLPGGDGYGFPTFESNLKVP